MSKADDIIQSLQHSSKDRATWESHWQEVSELVLPRYSNSFFAPEQNRSKGEKRTSKQFDATAAIGLERFAAVMESMLTPRQNKWHGLRANITELNRDKTVRVWFENVNEILFRHRYSTTANFASQKYEEYLSLGAFGTGCMFIDENAKIPGLRYRAVHLGEVTFAENHQGLIDTVFRKFALTAKQVQQKVDAGIFDLLPDAVQKALDSKKENEEFEIIHCVRPRKNYNPEKIDAKNKPFESCYVFVKDRQLLSEGGYETFPYTVSRYVTAPGEIYGRSPAMTALPSIKTLNEEKKTILKQGHRVVDPVLLAHDDGVLDTFSMRPGSLNAGGVSPEGRPLIHTLPTGSIAAGKDMMNMEQQVINDVFLVTLFQILVDTPQMTATEVLERTREKGMLLSPTMGRQQSESLGPGIERELDLLMRQNLLPEMPPLLIEAGGEFEIEYDSPLSRAQRAEEASGLFRTIEFATSYAQVTQNPSAFDWIDIDTAMPKIMDINAVPPSWQRSMEEVEEIRQGRAQAAQQQQMLDAAPAAAGMLKTVDGMTSE